jgi:uncharacterized integral membrane protein
VLQPPGGGAGQGAGAAAQPEAAGTAASEPRPGGVLAPGAPEAATSGSPASPGTATAPAPAAEPGEPAVPAGVPEYHKVRHTRLSGTWAAIILFALILVFLLIFILQNSRTVEVSYFGAHGHLPLGVALLLAAVCGALLVALAGSARIMQLRATARKHRRADVRAVKARHQR